MINKRVIITRMQKGIAIDQDFNVRDDSTATEFANELMNSLDSNIYAIVECSESQSIVVMNKNIVSINVISRA